MPQVAYCLKDPLWFFPASHKINSNLLFKSLFPTSSGRWTGNQKTWVWILISFSCVALGKLFDSVNLNFQHLWNMDYMFLKQMWEN